MRDLIDLAESDGRGGGPDLDETLVLLSESARAGSVMAQKELLRYLAEREEPEDRVSTLAKLLSNGR